MKAIKRIKKFYADKPRDLCLFTFGINRAYRAKEILSLKVGQIEHLEVGDRLELYRLLTYFVRRLSQLTQICAQLTWCHITA